MATSSLGFENFFSTTLNGAISDTDLTINLNAVPTPSEGFLVIEPDNASKREVVYYTSKGASSVTCPSGAGNGRGYDGTTATSHTDGASVIMAPVAAMFEALQDLSAVADGQVSTAKIADGAVTNAKLNTAAGELGGAWQTYSPTWTDLTVGNGTETHKYMQIGKTVFVQGSFTAGSTSSSTLSVSLSLPVAVSADYPLYAILGQVNYFDSSLTDFYYGPIIYGNNDEVILQSIYVYNTSEDAQALSTDMDATARPFQLATGDQITWSITYEAA